MPAFSTFLPHALTPQRYYKPFSTRTPALFVFFATIILCIVLLQNIAAQGTPIPATANSASNSTKSYKRSAHNHNINLGNIDKRTTSAFSITEPSSASSATLNITTTTSDLGSFPSSEPSSSISSATLNITTTTSDLGSFPSSEPSSSISSATLSVTTTTSDLGSFPSSEPSSSISSATSSITTTTSLLLIASVSSIQLASSNSTSTTISNNTTGSSIQSISATTSVSSVKNAVSHAATSSTNITLSSSSTVTSIVLLASSSSSSVSQVFTNTTSSSLDTSASTIISSSAAAGFSSSLAVNTSSLVGSSASSISNSSIVASTSVTSSLISPSPTISTNVSSFAVESSTSAASAIESSGSTSVPSSSSSVSSSSVSSSSVSSNSISSSSTTASSTSLSSTQSSISSATTGSSTSVASSAVSSASSSSSANSASSASSVSALASSASASVSASNASASSSAASASAASNTAVSNAAASNTAASNTAASNTAASNTAASDSATAALASNTNSPSANDKSTQNDNGNGDSSNSDSADSSSSDDDSSNSQTTPTSTTSDSPTTTQAVPASAYSGFLSQYVMAIPGKVTTSTVLNATFSSVTMSVAFKSFWCVVLASAKMMEPFYQLFRSSGATAFDSLTLPYLEGGVAWKSLNPLNKQWVMFLTTAISLMLSLLASIASESMTVRAGSTCTKNGGKTLCDPEWVINTLVLRGLQTVLGLSAVFIAVLMYLSWYNRSGLADYPASIASMADMLRHSDEELIKDLQAIDPEATNEEVIKEVANKCFALVRVETPSNRPQYGIRYKNNVRPSLELATSPEETTTLAQTSGNSKPWYKRYKSDTRPSLEITTSSEETTSPVQLLRPSKPWYKCLPWKSAFYFSLHLTLFIVILLFLIMGDNTYVISLTKATGHGSSLVRLPFKFLDGTKFGPRFFMSLATSMISSYWEGVELDVRILSPYRALSRSNLTKGQLEKMKLHGVPFTMVVKALWAGNWMHAFVAGVTVSSYLLIVLVAGVPYNYGQIANLSLISSAGSVGVLGLMLLAFMGVWLWYRTGPQMERKPDSLVNVWLLFCASNLLEEREDVDGQDARNENRRYWFGRGMGTDGVERWMVDEMVEKA